jgi:hypothetical protein
MKVYRRLRKAVGARPRLRTLARGYDSPSSAPGTTEAGVAEPCLVYTKKSKPFTLLELLVAVTVLGLVVALSVTAKTAVVDSWDRIRKGSEELEALVRVEEIAEKCLANAVAFDWPGTDASERLYVFEGRSDSVRFCCLRPAHEFEDGGLRFIELFLEDGELCMVDSPRPWFGSRPSEGDNSDCLMRDVESVQFRYAGYGRDGVLVWREEWVRSEDMPDLPVAIRVDVETVGGGRHCWLRRTAGNSRFTAMGMRREDNF